MPQKPADPTARLEPVSQFSVLQPRAPMGHYVFSPNGRHAVAARPHGTDAVFVALSLPTLEFREVTPASAIGFGGPHEKSGLSLAFGTLSISNDGVIAYVARDAKGGALLHVLAPDGAVRFTRPAVAAQTAFHPTTGQLCAWEPRPTDPYSELLFLDPVTGAELRRIALAYSSSEYTRPGLVFDRVSGDAITHTTWLDVATGETRPVPWGDGCTVLAFHDRSAVVREGTTWKRFTLAAAPVWTLEVSGSSALARADGSRGISVSFENASSAGVVTLIDLATGTPSALGPAAGARLSASDAWYHWPVEGPIVLAARMRVTTFDPLADVMPAGPLDVVGAASSGDELVTAHDDGVRWWLPSGGLSHFHAQRALGNDASPCQFSRSPDGKRLLVSGRSGAMVFDGHEVAWRYERPRFATWADDLRVAVGTAAPDTFEVVTLADGAVTPVKTGSGPNWSFLGRAGDRLFAAWSTGVDVFTPEGQKTASWKVPKTAKGYGAVTQLESVGEVWVLSHGRLFEWQNGKPARLLSSLDKALGFPKSNDYGGSIRAFAVDARFVVLVVGATNPRVVIVERATEAIVAETKTVPTLGQRLWLALHDSTLDVCADTGVVARFSMP